MLVTHIDRKIPVSIYLEILRCPRTQQMLISVKCFRGQIDPLFSKGYHISHISRDICKRFADCVIELEPEPRRFPGGLKDNPVPLFIFLAIDKVHFIVASADSPCIHVSI